MDFIEKYRSVLCDPKNKVIASGAFGLQYTLKYRHNIPGIKLNNFFNITVIGNGKLWLGIAQEYAKSRKLPWRRNKNIITIGDPCIIEITILKSNKSKYIIDQDLTEKAGVPIKKEEYYMADLFSMIKRPEDFNCLNQFEPYCDYLAKVTIENISKMNNKQRAEYFKIFAQAFGSKVVNPAPKM